MVICRHELLSQHNVEDVVASHPRINRPQLHIRRRPRRRRCAHPALLHIPAYTASPAARRFTSAAGYEYGNCSRPLKVRPPVPADLRVVRPGGPSSSAT
jgi:hypothetical protein